MNLYQKKILVSYGQGNQLVFIKSEKEFYKCGWLKEKHSCIDRCHRSAYTKTKLDLTKLFYSQSFTTLSMPQK